MTTEEVIKSFDYENFAWQSDGKSNKLMPYQIEGIKFLEKANARALLADEQGLGKTIQAGALLSIHAEQLSPFLIVTKSKIVTQWLHEMLALSNKKLAIQIITSGKMKAMDAFDGWIISYDLLKNEDIFEDIQPKTIILDECQAIKNHLADRAKAVQKIASKAEHILGLSGTPIKNNAGEYFTILNLLQPSRFPQYQRFIDYYCDHYESGFYQKIGGLRDPEGFRRRTEDFVIRRTKAEVLPDLPQLTRKFFHCEMDGKLKKTYDRLWDDFSKKFYEEDSAGSAAQIAIMTAMREITGVAKVETCIDFVTEFLLSTDRKIVIFAHHHKAVTLLELQLNSWLADGGFNKCIMMRAGDDAGVRVKEFRDNPNSRVMIASTLSAGEGLNLQFCSDAVMLERQWNPANEEQAEARFHRFGQLNPVSVNYMICSQTIDEYFTQLVEQKRAIVASALDGKVMEWNENSLMKELAIILATTGKKWSL